jgi:triphosphoribosyl-dephospho-CoA synthase
LTRGQCATLACLLEASAPKPGNVHCGSSFVDLTFRDLAVSAVAIAPALDRAPRRRLGETVLSAVRATRECVDSNANLGIILLLSPLASIRVNRPLRTGIADVLRKLTAGDATRVYQAIQLARPGGMGTVDQLDVAGPPPTDLMDAMRQAMRRDFIARQYANGFREVFDCVLPWLQENITAGWPLTTAIVQVHVRMMAKYPDSLIARKCGTTIARQSAFRAARVLAAGRPGDEEYETELASLDQWLRADGHRRNPGTTADLIAAGLYVGLREGSLVPPWR